jgi:hypothetical protein
MLADQKVHYASGRGYLLPNGSKVSCLSYARHGQVCPLSKKKTGARPVFEKLLPVQALLLDYMSPGPLRRRASSLRCFLRASFSLRLRRTDGFSK